MYFNPLLIKKIVIAINNTKFKIGDQVYTKNNSELYVLIIIVKILFRTFYHNYFTVNGHIF